MADTVNKLRITNARLSFPALFTPEAFKPGDQPMFKATLLVEKGSAQAKAIEAAILEAAKAKWGAKAATILSGIRGNANKFCYQDGDTKTYAGYEGMMAFGAKSATRPTVVDAARNPLVEADGKPYAGCYVNAIVSIFTYNNSGNGISAQLGGIQFVKDGDAFSGSRPAAIDDFDVIEGADAEDFA